MIRNGVQYLIVIGNIGSNQNIKSLFYDKNSLGHYFWILIYKMILPRLQTTSKSHVLQDCITEVGVLYNIYSKVEVICNVLYFESRTRHVNSKNTLTSSNPKVTFSMAFIIPLWRPGFFMTMAAASYSEVGLKPLK